MNHPQSSSPYDNLLMQYGDNVHDSIQDILNCKLEAIRKTSVHDIEPILNLFLGSTLKKKREALIDFLKLMPEYRTTDQEVLYNRLKTLQEQIKRTTDDVDLYYYALRRYNNTIANENNDEG